MRAGLYEQEPFLNRLQEEFKHISIHGEHDYFLELHESKTKYPYNENNLLVPYLLDIVNEFDIDKLPASEYGELPDIDVDFLPPIRDYLKDEWAPKEFGKDRVCNIGN